MAYPQALSQEVLREGDMWSQHVGPLLTSTVPCNSIGIDRRTPELAGFTCQDAHTEHVTGIQESGDTVANATLPETSSSMTGLAVGQ